MKLFEKGQIGKLTVKNRVVLAPMGAPADSDGGFSESTINFLEERAKGGVGLIITGGTAVSDEFEARQGTMHNQFSHNARLGRLADKVHAYGAKLCLQLSPGVGRLNFIDEVTPPYSASAVPSASYPDLICKPLSVEQIKRLVKAMGSSALLAKRAGVDMIEIHAYGGYLIDQFLSSHWNKREDEYGGSLENRMRFLMEIIEEIRKTCGKDFPLAVKYTVDSLTPGERSLDEGLEMTRILDNAAVDLLHVSRGSYACRYRMVGSVYQPAGFDLEILETVKANVKNLPVMVHGKLNHPDMAEKTVADGLADYIAIGRGWLAEPEWANKVKNHQWDDIQPCIGCGECHYNTHSGKILTCAVNPRTGFERDYVVTSADRDLKVLVIGAGPGGMKAAVTAAQRGFKVALWEKNTYMGGLLSAAGAPVLKSDIANYVKYMERQVRKADIDLRLGKEANVEDVKKYNPDFVVVATGANAIVIRVPGYDKPLVTGAEKVLLGEEKVGQNVVIIGGGLVGCETAVELSMQGKNVTIVEMLDNILKVSAHFVANDQNLRTLVANENITLETSAKLTEILDDGVCVEKDGEKKIISCDSVVFAVGYRSNHTLAEEIEQAGFEVVNIGDNVKPGKVFDAVHQGFHVIRTL